nr:putative ribonuclease H-like domain-containing protein [Tanacetum cinerariifolium]
MFLSKRKNVSSKKKNVSSKRKNVFVEEKRMLLSKRKNVLSKRKNVFVEEKRIAPQLDCDDLEQINDDDLEEMDLKWQGILLETTELKGIKTVEEEMVGIMETKLETMDDPHRALKDKGIVDSGCSRHMTGNKARLVDYQEFKDGYVAFGGSNGRIIEEQSSFTDTDCLVLSPDFKLLDENQASIDESNIQHRRPGHVNFKNLNKLVKGNLVRGLPSKIFKNDHFACQKRKQHKASYNLDENNANDIQDFTSEILQEHEEEVPRKGAKYPMANIAKGNLSNNAKAFAVSLCSEEIPSSFEQALKLEKWKKAMDDEMKALKKNKTWVQYLPFRKKAIGTKWVYRNKKDERGVVFRNKARLVTQGHRHGEGIDYDEFHIQKVWVLVDLPFRKKAIGTKWVYRNKKDERGVVFRNKARLVTQGHRHGEGIDYDEVFAPVARIEAIRIFLAFASYMGS